MMVLSPGSLYIVELMFMISSSLDRLMGSMKHWDSE